MLQDNVEDVYMFLDDQEGPGASSGGGSGSGAGGMSDMHRNAEMMGELPTGVFTPLTKCYLPSCMEGAMYACSSWTCPRRVGTVCFSTC